MKNRFCSNPKVTVMMPAYNAERYIKDSIESVLRQDFRDFELLIVEDGSLDNTYFIANSYTRDPRVRVYRNKENHGEGYTRNRILRLARGRYVAPHDADDVMLQGRLRKQVEFLDSHPNVGGVIGKILVCDEDLSKIEGAIVPCGTDGRALLRAQAINRPLRSMGICSSMIVRKWIILAGGFNPSLTIGTDSDLFRRLFRLTRTFFLNHFCLMYRIHPESTIRRQTYERSALLKAIFYGRAASHPRMFSFSTGNLLFKTRPASKPMMKTLSWRLHHYLDNEDHGQSSGNQGLKKPVIFIRAKNAKGKSDGERYRRGFLQPLSRGLHRKNATIFDCSLMSREGKEGFLVFGDGLLPRAKVALSFLRQHFFYHSSESTMVYFRRDQVYGSGFVDPLILGKTTELMNAIRGVFWNPVLKAYYLNVDLCWGHLIGNACSVSRILFVNMDQEARKITVKPLANFELYSLLAQDRFAREYLTQRRFQPDLLRALVRQSRGFQIRLSENRLDQLPGRF